VYLQLVPLILHLAKPRVNPVADELVVLQHTDFLYSCLQVLDFPLGEFLQFFPSLVFAGHFAFAMFPPFLVSRFIMQC